MFESLSRSWHLYLASWAVLRRERQLLLLPLISVIAAVAVGGVFVLGAFGFWAAHGFADPATMNLRGPGYAAAFVFYATMYFIAYFFNAALVGAALQHFDGGTPTVGSALRIAAGKAGDILGYALIAATVGVILRAIQERVGFVGRLVVALVGTGWTFATFLVVPVLVSRDVGPFEAVKESAGILRATWGENLAGRAGMSFAFGVVHLLVFAACALVAVAGLKLGSVALVALAVVAAVLATIVLALAHAALAGIYSAALYRFATGGAMTDGFDGDAMKTAFRRK